MFQRGRGRGRLVATGAVMVLVTATGCSSPDDAAVPPVEESRLDRPTAPTTSPTTSPTRLPATDTTVSTTTTVELGLADDEVIETEEEARILLAMTPDDVDAPAAIAEPMDDGLRSVLDRSMASEDLLNSVVPESSSRLLTTRYLICNAEEFGPRCIATVAEYLEWVDRCRTADGRLSERMVTDGDAWAAIGICFWTYTDDLRADVETFVSDHLTDRGYSPVAIGRFGAVAQALAQEMVALDGTESEGDLDLATERLQASDAVDVLGPDDRISCLPAGYSVVPARLSPEAFDFLDGVDDDEDVEPGRLGMGVGVEWSEAIYVVIVCYTHFG